ncbi:MAG: IS66 family transposase [Acidimicrobiales bacterium]
MYQHLPYERMAELFSDVLGIGVSVGSLRAMVTEAGGALGLFSSVVRDLLKDAPAVHFDETGARVAARLAWVHVACSALLTLLSCHERRGRVAMDEMGVIAKMAGIAVHDGRKPYRSYDVTHTLCNAHHLRELDGIGVVFDQSWAGEMIALLLDAKAAVERATAAGSDRLDPSVLHSIRVRYGMVVAKGWAANPSPEHGKRHGAKRTAANLLKRLDTQRDEVLRFASDFRANFDNNEAEYWPPHAEDPSQGELLLQELRGREPPRCGPLLHLDRNETPPRSARRLGPAVQRQRLAPRTDLRPLR